MIECTTCAACGEMFGYDAPQHLLADERAYELSVRFGLDAPLLCGNCNVDDAYEGYEA